MTHSRILTIVLGVAALFSGVLLASRSAVFHLPGNQQGYEPVQPIAYSHRLHAGELQIHCQYCHFGADKSRHAGIPPASVCMNCHKFVTAPLGAVRAEDELAEKEKRSPRPIVSAELRKLYDAVERGQPIGWTRIHSLPDFAYFDHRPHVNAGVACQQCHGPVESMERVRQVSDLTMGWCVNCHREANRTGVAGRRVYASTNCSTCHF
jgi:hypothetical protein